MKTTFLAAIGLAALTGAASAQCFEVGPDGSQMTEISGYDLRAETARPGLMDPPPLSEAAAGMMCVRDSVVPDANDFELVRYRGVPLFIRDGADEDATILALGFAAADVEQGGDDVPPQYLVRRVQGDLTQDDVAAIRAALEGFAEAESALDAYMAGQAEN